MPIYVYACDACEVEFEEVKPLGCADDLEACPLCRRLIGRAPTAATYLRGRPAPIGGDARPRVHPVDCDCCLPARGRPAIANRPSPESAPDDAACEPRVPGATTVSGSRAI